MDISVSPLLFKNCKIKPFEDLEGVIIGLNQSKKGTELQVRYFLNGEYRTDWFFDFDIEVEKLFIDKVVSKEEFNEALEKALEKLAIRSPFIKTRAK